MPETITKQDNAGTAVVATPYRLFSLDALRGFDMFWIVSGEFIFHGLATAMMQKHALVRNPETWQISTSSDLSWWEHLVIAISNQLHHSPWNGFTFYDLVFPLFIFIAGVSMPFSIGNQLSKIDADISAAKRRIYRNLFKRALTLVILGMIVNGLLQWTGYESTRFASVLGRIGLSCFFAAIIFMNTSWRSQVYWIAGILLGYWALMACVPVPGFGKGVYTPEGNLSAYIDRLFLPGKLHRKVYDPEGILATLPAVVSALLGVQAGQLLRWQPTTFRPMKKAGIITIAGLLMLGLGWCWGIIFPINKIMWTSSFVLFAGGWSALLLALFYYITDIKGYKNWSLPFVWIGANSILIYMAAHGLINFETTSMYLFGGIINKLPLLWQPAAIWFGVFLIQCWALRFLHKRKLFWKI